MLHTVFGSREDIYGTQQYEYGKEQWKNLPVHLQFIIIPLHDMDRHVYIHTYFNYALYALKSNSSVHLEEHLSSTGHH